MVTLRYRKRGQYFLWKRRQSAVRLYSVKYRTPRSRYSNYFLGVKPVSLGISTNSPPFIRSFISAFTAARYRIMFLLRDVLQIHFHTSLIVHDFCRSLWSTLFAPKRVVMSRIPVDIPQHFERTFCKQASLTFVRATSPVHLIFLHWV
jgi:hypothetical protein